MMSSARQALSIAREVSVAGLRGCCSSGHHLSSASTFYETAGVHAHNVVSIPFDWISISKPPLITDELVEEGQRKKEAAEWVMTKAAAKDEEE